MLRLARRLQHHQVPALGWRRRDMSMVVLAEQTADPVAELAQGRRLDVQEKVHRLDIAGDDDVRFANFHVKQSLVGHVKLHHIPNGKRLERWLHLNTSEQDIHLTTVH